MTVRPRLFAVLFALAPLAACDRGEAPAARAPFEVVAEKAALTSFESAVTLTGVVRAQIQSDLSFRISGRVIARNADVGQHVGADDVLARLDPTEQEADLKSAQAGLAGAEAAQHQADANFQRQKTLLGNGYATQAAFDLADRAQRTAAGSLDVARAQLTAAQDALSYTFLKAGHPGVITARDLEVGQVAQAAQMAFVLAQDGPRDAVFQVYEAALNANMAAPILYLALVSDPNVRTTGRVREISPVVDAKNGTVQVKVEIDPKGPELPLGAAVTGTGKLLFDNVFVLPWLAMTAQNGQPALFVVDDQNVIHLRAVNILRYDKERMVVNGGLKPGELVVLDGVKFLRDGQKVTVRAKEPA